VIRELRTIWIREECSEILDGLIPRLFICGTVTGVNDAFKLSAPVDVRYFPSGGVRDAELDAMDVFKLRRRCRTPYNFFLMIR
jgi:hypothetical protein